MHLQMSPPTDSLVRRYVGDQLEIILHAPDAGADYRAFLRTNLGRIREQGQAVIDAVEGRQVHGQTAWHSLPMRRDGTVFRCTVTLVDAGAFAAKAFLLDAQDEPHWPAGTNLQILVHPAAYRSGNAIYCAFVRQFGADKRGPVPAVAAFDDVLTALDRHGFAVIPPSGTLRDLATAVPHIVDRLGCRILHLLPINPVPTTFARYGRYGSPYAALDFTAIDPALIEHDKCTTAEDQFGELIDTVHRHGGRLFLDLAINHTGWGSWLQNHHPEWFVREDDGTFHSPGAWGVTWEDLSELDYHHRELWRHIADCFLIWCRRGVDGFRCDAGYMVPVPAWQYITAKVHQRFPDTVFLLEGLGGSWEITQTLLTTGGMQWCYSELFQNYDAAAINGYLRYALEQSRTRGLWVHYSETHDNERLAADPDGAAWSLFRNRLCALCSVDGGFGFTAGVEWLARERVVVHGNASLNWNADHHLCDALANLIRLLDDHPCFRDGAVIEMLNDPKDHTVQMLRSAVDGSRQVVVLANPDRQTAHRAILAPRIVDGLGDRWRECTGAPLPAIKRDDDGAAIVTLPPLSCYALTGSTEVSALSGPDYRRLRAVHAWAVRLLGSVLRPQHIPTPPWEELATLADGDPLAFIAACAHLPSGESLTIADLHQAMDEETTPRLSQWRAGDASRVLPLPAHHCLVVRHPQPFRVHLQRGRRVKAHRRSVTTGDGQIAVFLPRELEDVGEILLHDIDSGAEHRGRLQLLDARCREAPPIQDQAAASLLLTNGRGGMAFMPVVPAAIESKYHCALAANLDSQIPSDRLVLLKRLRLWIRLGGFTAALDDNALLEVEPGPPARWRWRCAFAHQRVLILDMQADLLPGRNTLVVQFAAEGDAPEGCELIIRCDCEDRSFHAESDLSTVAAQNHFRTHTRPLGHDRGFLYEPDDDRRLEVWCERGRYQHQEEISRNIPHPHEATRGQRDRGDAWSPGWFAVPLNAPFRLIANAEAISPKRAELDTALNERHRRVALAIEASGTDDWFGQALAKACQAFVVRREQGHSVIAGYPWFLDWGRDTLICARGLLTAGLHEEVLGILAVFGRFEKAGTLPNCIFGADARNRDTSDAPLWYGMVAEDAAERLGKDIYQHQVDADGRTIAEVLRAIACGYLAGTPNGIRVDTETGLVWSPGHFSWMDTNHPAGTPRIGYPVEIQALWIRLLRQLARLDSAPPEGEDSWNTLAERATAAFDRLFWLADRAHLSDCLHAPAGVGAASAQADNALRCNCLLAVALGITDGPHARLTVTAARDWLIVPGAIRSLAPREVRPPLEIRDIHGHLIGNPKRPYRGHYQGDEDRERKPAYHNGTAWTWPFPVFCEAYARAFDLAPAAQASARAYLSSMRCLLDHGCLGQIPEILDGDAPHSQRGCLAQAWGATEALRVWRWLDTIS